MSDLNLKDFSLLYPSAAAQQAHLSGRGRPNIDDFTLEELGLTEVFPLKNSNLSEFITADPAVIRYREAVFGDLLAHEEISKTIGHLLPVLYVQIIHKSYWFHL